MGLGVRTAATMDQGELGESDQVTVGFAVVSWPTEAADVEVGGGGVADVGEFGVAGSGGGDGGGGARDGRGCRPRVRWREW